MAELLPADKEIRHGVISKVLGPRCDQFHRDCMTCVAWAMSEEIERLEYIQRDFHNIGDVAEIKRLRTAIHHYVRARKEGLGELAHYWWTLQQIAAEDDSNTSTR